MWYLKSYGMFNQRYPRPNASSIQGDAQAMEKRRKECTQKRARKQKVKSGYVAPGRQEKEKKQSLRSDLSSDHTMAHLENRYLVVVEQNLL